MKDKETVIKSLEQCAIHENCNRCAYEGPGFGIACRQGLMYDAWLFLAEKIPAPAPRLMTAEEVRNLEAGTPVVVERYAGHNGRFFTLKIWGVCAVTGKLITSYDGDILLETVNEIPYRASCTRRDNGEQEHRLYRFWTAKPTDEQSMDIRWDEGGYKNGSAFTD